MACLRNLAESNIGVTVDYKPRQNPALIRKASITEKCINTRTQKCPIKMCLHSGLCCKAEMCIACAPYQHCLHSVTSIFSQLYTRMSPCSNV